MQFYAISNDGHIIKMQSHIADIAAFSAFHADVRLHCQYSRADDIVLLYVIEIGLFILIVLLYIKEILQILNKICQKIN